MTTALWFGRPFAGNNRTCFAQIHTREKTVDVSQFFDPTNQVQMPTEFRRSIDLIPVCRTNNWDGFGFLAVIENTFVPNASAQCAVCDTYEELTGVKAFRAIRWSRRSNKVPKNYCCLGVRKPEGLLLSPKPSRQHSQVINALQCFKFCRNFIWIV